MKNEQPPQWVPPEKGKKLFKIMRGHLESGKSATEKELKQKFSEKSTEPKTSKTSARQTQPKKSTRNSETSAGAMNRWQNEHED